MTGQAVSPTSSLPANLLQLAPNLQRSATPTYQAPAAMPSSTPTPQQAPATAAPVNASTAQDLASQATGTSSGQAITNENGTPIDAGTGTILDWLFPDAAEAAVETAADPGGVGAQAAEEIASMLQQWSQGWDQGMGGPPPGALEGLQNLLSQWGFQQSSLVGDVGQNWTTAMDPGAWEQRADNLMAMAQDQGRADLNLAERRMANSAARSGLANAGGGYAAAHNQYAGNMQDARRNIWNDSVQQQLAAVTGAGQFANQQQALDQQRWSQGLGLLGQANLTDTLQANSDYLGFGEAVGALLGGVGGMMNNAQNSAGAGLGSIAAMLPFLPMLAGIPV
jgi:hypothetical protein